MKKRENIICAKFEYEKDEEKDRVRISKADIKKITGEEKSYKSITGFFQDLTTEEKKPIVYVHNLDFYGFYILDFLDVKGFKPAFTPTGDWMEDGSMGSGNYKYQLSEENEFFSITVKNGRDLIEFRDFSKIFKGEFNNAHEMMEYLEKMEKYGRYQYSASMYALKEFKKITGEYEFDNIFPRLDKMQLDKETYGSENADEYVRKALRGGFNYLNLEKAGKVIGTGVEIDRRSMYPYTAHSASGNKNPYGLPNFKKGDEILQYTKKDFFVILRIEAVMKVKEEALPWIQIKDNPYIDGTTYLTKTATPKGYISIIITVTEKELYLLEETYDIKYKILDGCAFYTAPKMFDEYIDKWFAKKENAKNEIDREIAKKMLNGLIGKFGSTAWRKKTILKKENDVWVRGTEKKELTATVYAPITINVTANARVEMVKKAIKYKDRYIYADTDSLFLEMSEDEIKEKEDIRKGLGGWKIERTWECAKFSKRKQYVAINGNEVYVCMAGIPTESKEKIKEVIKTKEDLENVKKIEISNKVMKRTRGGEEYTDMIFKYEL